MNGCGDSANENKPDLAVDERADQSGEIGHGRR